MAPRKLEVIAEPGVSVFTTKRVVDAPRDLVFEAFTSPVLLQRWLTPHGLTMVSCECDLHVGGQYRLVHRAHEGNEFVFHGEFREIIRPARIVRTFVFEAKPAHVALETLTLDERDGKTTITTQTVYETVEARDAHLGNGRMEVGLNEAYENLDVLLDSMQVRHDVAPSFV